jgi:hypothetical protein
MTIGSTNKKDCKEYYIRWVRDRVRKGIKGQKYMSRGNVLTQIRVRGGEELRSNGQTKWIR